MKFIKRLLNKVFKIRASKEKVLKEEKKYFGSVNKMGNNVKLGKSISFGGNILLFDTAEIIIGDHTMLGYGSIIHTSTHDYNEHPMWKKRIDRPVKIGKHVWIGTAVTILPGIIIGDYSVVAAGSLVNAHVPEKAIVAGNPARIVSYRKEQNFDVKVADYPDGAVIEKKGHLPKNNICKMKD